MTRSRLLPLLALVVLALVPVLGGPAASAAPANRPVATETRPATDARHRADRADGADGTAGMPGDRLAALSIASIGLTGLALGLLFLQDRRRRSAEPDPTG